MPVFVPLILRRPDLSTAPLISRPESPFFSVRICSHLYAAPPSAARLAINLQKIISLPEGIWEFHELEHPYAFKAQPAPYAPSLYFGSFT
jgi:hypothetical protein